MTTGSQQSGGWWPAEDDAATSWLPEREPPPSPARPRARRPPPHGRVAAGAADWRSSPPSGSGSPRPAGGCPRPTTAAVDAHNRDRRSGRATPDRRPRSSPGSACCSRPRPRLARSPSGPWTGRPSSPPEPRPGPPGCPGPTCRAGRCGARGSASTGRRRGAMTAAPPRWPSPGPTRRAFVQATVNDAIAWAQAQAIPQIVDGLVPHMVDSVGPADHRRRDAGDPVPGAAGRDRGPHHGSAGSASWRWSRGGAPSARPPSTCASTSASADDRVESAFHRLVRGSGGQPSNVDDVRGRATDQLRLTRGHPGPCVRRPGLPSGRARR